ncbi:MAG: type I-U CRISPR-associated protein Csb2 [Gammaproteobacteria bacterium]|nr:type I-U CRISPR-associated protein Csb2 [Gammaproteobacteria bacterium]MDE0269958.1 type I-U CRISPR-associated protein Csb2 [Gammaproteobacteria bacterium]
MFALGIRYLNGWSMAASDGARKQQAEWPPHPDRVFMALAAAWFETGEDNAEGEALRWLEELPPPCVGATKASYRTAVVSYVPVNDESAPVEKKSGKWKPRPAGYLPIGRNRQPRGFPVAVPHNPVVHLIWPHALNDHASALRRLATKVTHVGHSASLVQAWIEEHGDVQASLMPTNGIAECRLRVPSTGRLAYLSRSGGRNQWLAYHDLRGEIERAKVELKEMKQPPRAVWKDFPDAVLLASEPATKQHPDYAAAKSGDASAATRLVRALIDEQAVAKVQTLLDLADGGQPTLVSASAYERGGFNAIPSALAKHISKRLGVPSDPKIVQSNVVSHTGSSGYGRLARQAAFEGKITSSCEYLLVDDFVGQGGTLANLRGLIERRGGRVIGAVALTGKPYSAKLNPTEEQINELRAKHGKDFEQWWRQQFGHTFHCLTQSEARYLTRSPDADTIRDRLAAEVRTGGGRNHRRSLREQRRYVKELTEQFAERFPQGAPRQPSRPTPGKWQGYASPPEEDPSAPHSIFDPRLVVLGIRGQQVSLPTTLKLTAALRGLLMRECPRQPPPEWFSGHDGDGRPTKEPHIALAPLPFVGARHADGHILGLALILPRNLAPEDAGKAFNTILHDTTTGLPREHRLFDGQWLECAISLESRERPPLNLTPGVWTKPSQIWASVTPVALNRHFDGADRWERAAESVKGACEDIGLPRPSEVLLHPVSLVEGVPHAREFPRIVRKPDGGRRSHAHAVLVFDEPVSGPLLVGAGRFRGYGLCRPLDSKVNEPKRPGVDEPQSSQVH